MPIRSDHVNREITSEDRSRSESSSEEKEKKEFLAHFSICLRSQLKLSGKKDLTLVRNLLDLFSVLFSVTMTIKSNRSRTTLTELFTT